MSARQPPLDMLTYRPRYARPGVRWAPFLALLTIPPAVPVVDTPAGMVAVGVAAALAAVTLGVRWRLMRTAARIEEIIETELAPRDDGGNATR